MIIAARASAGAVAIMAAGLAADWAAQALPGLRDGGLQLLCVAGCAVLVVVAAGRQEHRWNRAARQLTRLLAEIQAGDAPVDELLEFGGPLAPLAAEAAEMARELRRQKTVVGELNEELRQRVANRTTALERMLAGFRNQAERDALTGLHNRRMLDQHLPRVVKECIDEQLPLTVLMIDVDYFKLLNDTLGHPAGDELLRAIGQLIRSTVRDNDMAFRCGGDEFVIVMPGADDRASQALQRRLETLVDALAKPLKVAKKPRLSIGRAALDAGKKTPEDLLKRADAALYKVKSERKSLRAA
jgi:diguanylate cyclase (GGDEF)-like protein